jgi:hypothetical protein
MATVERVEVVRDGHWSARSISILAALALNAGLIWLLYFQAKYNPPVGEAELFWGMDHRCIWSLCDFAAVDTRQPDGQGR